MMAMVRCQSVSMAGCFFSPLLRRKSSSKKGSSRARVESEPDYVSDLETLSRWSVSFQKSFILSFLDSSSLSSFSSYQSSPRPLNDIEWLGLDSFRILFFFFFFGLL
ncbi:hypothetical protein FEM48_Zijuj06G0129900 [Ziziphus jujuba var. spinosa]|uniref:Uncharacterized protein n=1 Tax=Ziziphus jujuba var. spinosa TaxID=714518 RepID=A0A978V9F1_ZIZJJ|nr:hypothetical protein FEM48_Zijuj06G0129900 [Ziziphus jujuba var. spinosa]